MPLIILSGFPCSGKTRRAEQLRAHFEATPTPCPDGWPKAVHIVNDEALRISRSDYQTAATEKQARAALLSAVERLLSPDVLVIVDAMNYIKGLRYQLYCVARNLTTPHCVIQCGVQEPVAREWNRARGDEGYDEKTFDELVSRYEEPDGKNRWDAPLFFVMHWDESLPFAAIEDAIVHRKAPPPNQSTMSKPLTETNYVYELDKATNELVLAFFQAQSNNPPGAMVTLLDCTTKIQIPAMTVALATLKGIRRQFLKLNQQRTTNDVSKVKELFIHFLSESVHK
ncbi:kti12, chromatin associated [Allomyces arbusculus]|nr:kti12, chromatin associated [Allomyces arbusculus]